ncbi:MAG: response regulator [bacterium]|nr:response regulator [bacterium]
MIVLAIDPEQNNQDAISEQVLRDRNQFVGLSNADQGLAYLRGHAPDVVLTNRYLPGRDGFELMRASLAKTPP